MSLEDDIDLLRRVPLFEDFNAEHLRLISFGSQKINLSKGQDVYQDGERADSGFVIISGSVDLIVFKNGYEDKKRLFNKGSLLGEMSLITVTNRTGTAVARQDCELMKISRTVMHRVLNEYPELAVNLKRRISANVLEFSNRVQRVRL